MVGERRAARFLLYSQLLFRVTGKYYENRHKPYVNRCCVSLRKNRVLTKWKNSALLKLLFWEKSSTNRVKVKHYECLDNAFHILLFTVVFFSLFGFKKVIKRFFLVVS